jgi:DNA (cytosine-5)-methyltransferase 1
MIALYQICHALNRALETAAERTPKLKVLDLFSGIGGFSLGLERTGGFETVAFCEIEDYPRRVLKKHWPKVPIYDDVRTLTADALSRDGIAVDVICGGFPCQDISRAGTGAGLAGERSGLWSEFARLIGEIRPSYAILENVAALLDDGMGTVLGNLADLGYDAEWQVISACAVGAPHMRQRVFVVAYPNGEHGRPRVRHSAARKNRPLQEVYDLASARARENARMANPSALYRDADGVAFGMERNRAIGNGIYPAVPELIGRAILASLHAQQADDRTVTPTPA